MPNERTTHFPARKRLIVAAIAACFVSAPAWSNPTAPQVVNGSASFNQAGKLLTVTNSNGAIINWNTFSIGANETTRFNQTSAASSVLNRVITNDPSVLLGALSSNGRVWLVNPAGIMVGQGARIDVAGFIASTLNVRNEDFLAGRLNFQATPNAGKLENSGQITTPSGGSVYLIAPSVTNNGIINAPNGEVLLAAGQTVQLIDTGTPGVKVNITGAEGNVTNLGEIVSEAGRIGMAGVLVKNSGTLSASSLVREGGRIFLKASQDAYVDGAGRIVVTGTKGGNIEVLGNRVAVTDQAQLDASGSTGGGTVLVGGDAHGANPAVQNAQQTLIGPDAVIRADARTTGDGGRVIVWADDTTQFYGAISARGGAQSGNGGYVETSASNLVVGSIARVDTAASHGTVGSWLLDPTDINVVATAANPDTTLLSNVNAFGVSDMGSGSTSIDVASINNSSTTVTLQATHDVNFNTSVAMTTPGAGLTAQANNNIALNSNNITTAGGSITLSANYSGFLTPSGVGAITSSAGYGNITTSGGNITLSGVGVTVGALNTTGISGTAGTPGTSVGPGNSGGAGGAGGDGGTVTIQANASITTGSITTTGGVGGRGGDATGEFTYHYPDYPAMGGAGGMGGKGGDVVLTVVNPGGTINTGNIDTSGGQGGAGGNTAGYNIYYYWTSHGYTPQSGGAGGTGGHGGTVTLQANTSIATASITTTGGTGGKGGDGSGDLVQYYYPSFGGNGGTGGTGGDVVLTVSSPTATINVGDIGTTGGQGGAGGNASGTYYFPYTYYNQGGYGGTGGTGGNLIVVGTNGLSGTVVSVGGGTGSIITGGGTGGAGGAYANGSYWYSGGYGSDGNIKLSAQSGDITLSAFPLAFGTLSTRSSNPYDAGGTLQIAASNNIGLGADITIPSTANIGGDIQFRAGNNINPAYGGSPHSITAAGQSLTLSANDDLTQPNATFNAASGTGSIIGGGNITTGGGVLTLTGYGVTVGAINASGPLDGSIANGSVGITTSGGDISTSNITTGALNSYSGAGSVTLTTTGGHISVTGNIDARGANGNSTYNGGSSGGNVDLIRTGTTPPSAGDAVHVTGSVLTYGGDALAGSGVSGGQGGYVNIAGQAYARRYTEPALIGNITIDGTIDTHGGNGSNGVGDSGGNGRVGGDVFLAGSGAVTLGVINTYGGDAGNSGIGYGGRNGGDGGYVTLYGSSVTVNGSTDTHGGVGGDGGVGGSGSNCECTAGAGHGGRGGNVNLGADGNPVVALDVYGGSVATLDIHVFGSIDTHGGGGGMGLVDNGHSGAGNGGYGGQGGAVTLAGTGAIAVDGDMLSYGGNGGDGSAIGPNPSGYYPGGSGGSGGIGGNVSVYGGSIAVGNGAYGNILAYGGQGGLGGDGNSANSGGNGAPGGNGGNVNFNSASGDITVLRAIDTSGGNAGNGGAYGGSVANAGYGGYVYLDASGAVAIGNITTNGGDATLSGYGVAVGAITTSGPSDGSYQNGDVSISTSAGDISTNNITTRATNSNWDAGSVVLQTGTGTITVNGTIDASGANGDSTYTLGSSGGNVDLLRTGTTAPLAGDAVHVTGSILTYGGDALAGRGSNGGGGGHVNVASQNYNDYSPTALLGNITIGGSIDTHGGNGAEFIGGNGGQGRSGGEVYLLASGSVASGAINTFGGDGGNGRDGEGSFSGGNGGDGGPGGYVSITGASISTIGDTIGAITTRGGNGGNGGAGESGTGAGGNAGYGGYVYLDASGGAVNTGDIDTRGGNGGNAGVGSTGLYGGDGGWGGSVEIYNTSSIATGLITTRGGEGGHGGGDDGYWNNNHYTGNGHYGAGWGGDGGGVNLQSTGAIIVGAIDVSGGNGGSSGPAPDGNTYSAGSGGNGGYAAYDAYPNNVSGVTISSDVSIAIGGGTGTITARGGNGGSEDCCWGGGSGGSGGYVYLTTPGLGGTVATGGIYTTGGTGGHSTESAGSSGSDGYWSITADSVIVTAASTDFLANTDSSGTPLGNVTANVFEFDPDASITSLPIYQGSFNAVSSVPTVKFGKDNGTTGADLVLTGAIDLTSTSINTLSLKTTGAVTQQDSYTAAYDATLAVNNLYAQGGSVSLVGGPNRNGNNVANLRGNATSGDFEFYNYNDINIGFSDPYVTTGAAGISASGNVSLYSDGAITQSASAPIVAAGLNALGSTVMLNDQNNSVGTLQGGASNGDFVFNNLGSLVIGTVNPNDTPGLSVTGTANLSVGGTLTQSVALILPGALAVNAGSDVILTDPGNRIDGQIDIATAGVINLNNASPLTTLGNISGGTLTLEAAGSVRQAASMILPGALWVNAGGNVVLTDPLNRIDGRIDIATTASSYINLNNASPLTTLGNISGAWFYGYGAGDVNVLGTVTGPGGIHIEAGANGIWSPSGSGGNLALAVGSALDAGSSFIELAAYKGSGTSNGDITFTGASMTMSAGSQGVFLYPDGDVGLGQITASGAPVKISAGGTISGAGTNITAGDATLTSLNGSAPGTFAISAGVNVTGTLTASVNGPGGDVQLRIGSTVPSSLALTPATSGRWLVYSSVDPGNQTLAGLGYDFKQYAASFGGTVLGAGNGLLYSVAPAALTPSLVGTVSKVYDGTNIATLSDTNYSLSGAAIGSDVIKLTTSGLYDDKNWGAGKTVTASGLEISAVDVIGKPVFGYQLSTSSISATIGNIDKAPLGVTAPTVSKTYDGTTSVPSGFVASVGALAGATGGGDAIATAANLAYADKNAGTGNKTVNASVLVIKDSVNADMTGNYAITYVPDTISTISQRALTLAAPAVTKAYDGTKVYSTQTADLTALSGQLVGGDAVTAATIAYTNKNAGTGNKVVTFDAATIKDGNLGANYTVTLAGNSTSTINPLAVTLTSPAVTKTYDGAKTYTTQTADLTALSGQLVGGDAVTAATIAYTNKNAGTGNKAVTFDAATINDGNLGANYAVTLAGNSTSTINPAPLTVTAAGVNKVYDGLTSASVTYGDNRVAGDVLTSSGSASYLDKNAGIAKTVNVSGITLAGTDAGNYTFNTTAATTADITVRPLSTWIGGATGNWSTAANWDALPDLSNVLAVSVPTGKSVTYDAAAGSTNLASLTAAGLSIAGGSLNIANSLTVNSSFSQTGGTLGFGGGANASITQATGNLNLPALAVANLSLNAPAGAITQSGRIAALTLNTQSQGATTLNNADNQVSGRVDMTAGGPLSLWASGDLILGAINAGANPVEIKAGGAILKAAGTETSTNIIAGAADLASIFGGKSGDLAISTDTQITGALTATVGAGADYGGIRIKNSGAQPVSVTLIDNALAGAGVSFLNTGDITGTSGFTLKTLKGGDLALLSNGNITWDGGNLSTPSGSVLISADGTIAVTGALSSPVDLALSSGIAIKVNGSVSTDGTGTAAFTAPSVVINGSVSAADDVGVIANTINLGAGSNTSAGHDVIFAAANVTATNASVAAGHDISAAVTGDLRLNGSGFTAGNDIFIKLMGATSTLYLNDAAGLPRSFLWAQAPSTIHLDFPARAAGGMVVDGVAVDPLTYAAAAGGSGLFFGAIMAPATPGTGLELTYANGTAVPGTTTVAPTVVDAVVAAISASTTAVTRPTGPLSSATFDVNRPPSTASGGTLGSGEIGGTEGTFGGSTDAKKDDDKNKTDAETGLKKQADKPTTKRLATCS